LGFGWKGAAVQHVLDFAATLRDPMDPAKPYRLLAWQEAVARRLYGWRRPDGRRRFSRLSLWVPKKNGKSSFLSFLGLAFLLADGERRPGCFVLSTNGERSAELYEEAGNMIAGTPWQRMVEATDYRHEFFCRANGGKFHAVTADSDGAQGLRGSFIVVDEAHAILRKRPRLYATLRYSGSGRRQPVTAVCSTAGDNRQALPYKLYRRARQILDSEIIDLETLPVIYEAQDKEDYTDAELIAANPAIGEILELDQLKRDYDEARSTGYGLEDFQRYRLNVWTRRASAWLDVNKWNACRDESLTLAGLAGRDCYIGVDLSGELDLTAACAVVPLDERAVAFLPHFWLPASGIEDRCIREMDYKAAEAAGAITLVPGPRIDAAMAPL
jgi:phage terminase large subunit-like protein